MVETTKPISPATSGLHRPAVQADPSLGKVPRSVRSLMDLEYLERAMHRMLAGWGGQLHEWDDKIAVCRHVWQQAEIVQRLRVRIDQFPGVTAGGPVAGELETLANTVLQAPSLEDAVDGIYQILNTALVSAYLDFSQRVHPIHDAPTHAILQEIITIKDLQRKWRSEYRRRCPHTTDAAYRNAIGAQLQRVDHLRQPLPPGDRPAQSVGVNTAFRPRTPCIPQAWLTREENDIMPPISRDFSASIEARRLFWPIGYMRELGLALEQLRWLYDSPHMPWAFHYDISRHMWDESRHGDSGYSRMKDFGITIEEVGFTWAYAGQLAEQFPATPHEIPALSPKDLYEAMFFIGMVAETGHFRVKREAYADFLEGGDMESAEMMLYDIIDETAHVQYAHKWLPELARAAGVDNTGYDVRAAGERRLRQEAELQRAEQTRSWEEGDPRVGHYRQLIQRLAERCPLSNAATCPPRSPRPM